MSETRTYRPAGNKTSFQKRRPQQNNHRRGGGPAKRAVKKFDPSAFIKVVEPHTTVAYQPKNQFADFLIEDQIKKNIIEKGYITPTPIQDQVIPVLLQGRDVIATANTGTGKTAAFLIPLVSNVLAKKTNRVLIIAPTRELAGQIQQELNFFKTKTHIHSVLCIGGVSLYVQMKALRSDPEFIIGTPGRLKDLENNRCINFSQYDAIVLDEVDTMLDMGFLNDITYIINKLPKNRHSLFFSATVPASLKTLMNNFLSNPVSISVKTRQAAENVNQQVVQVTAHNKIDVLHDLLIKPECKKSILFLRTRRSADKLSKILIGRGFKIATIHGDKTQSQRNLALSGFKSNKVQILLATDVVARGIDIDDVSHVINFDLPQTYEDYIHRIGRTGRADKLGQAITFIEQPSY